MQLGNMVEGILLHILLQIIGKAILFQVFLYHSNAKELFEVMKCRA